MDAPIRIKDIPTTATSTGAGDYMVVDGPGGTRKVTPEVAAAAAVAGLATFHVGLYGAVGNGQKLQDGAITSGTTAFTSAGSSFTVSDVGKAISVRGAGTAGAPLTTTIAAVVSPTAVTLAAAAGSTVSAAHFAWGTDDSASFQAAINAAYAGGGGTVRFGADTYYLGASIAPLDGVNLIGVKAATTMPTATWTVDEFWDLNADRKYQWANKGGTVFVGPADLIAISFARRSGYLTGCVFEDIAHDGLLSLLKIGGRDDYGAANCRFTSCNGVNSTGYTLDICNSQLLLLTHCYSIYSAGLLHFSAQSTGAAGAFKGSSGNSTVVECFGALGPLGDSNHGIWIDADGGPIDAITFVRPQVNRLQVSDTATSAACMRIQGRNGTNSIVQYIRLIDPDFEGFVNYLLDVSFATGCFMEFFKMAEVPGNLGSLRLVSSVGDPCGGNVIMSGYQATIEYDGIAGNQLFGLAKTFTNKPMGGFYDYVDQGGYLADGKDFSIGNNFSYSARDSGGVARKLMQLNASNCVLLGDVNNALGVGSWMRLFGHDSVELAVNGSVKFGVYPTYSSSTGQHYFDGYPKLKSYTVAQLGSAATDGAGSMKYCTDLVSATHGATATTGGSLKAVVVSDGTNWIVQ